MCTILVLDRRPERELETWPYLVLSAVDITPAKVERTAKALEGDAER
jgi:hypothetical protein